MHNALCAPDGAKSVYDILERFSIREKEESAVENRQLEELCRRAADRGQPLFSRFLDLDGQKQAEAAARKAGAAYTFFAGAEAPEESEFPILCLKISPRSAKYGKPLEHRDVLGTVMGLGITRDLIGDIIIREEGAYLFCVSSMADFLRESLVRVGRTDTACVLSAPPEGPVRKVREVRVQVASVRTDAVCAHLFRLSRGDTQELIRQGRVAVDDRICMKSDQVLSEGQVLSVRGFGRARVKGVESVSKKGKLNLVIEVYS